MYKYKLYGIRILERRNNIELNPHKNNKLRMWKLTSESTLWVTNLDN